MGVSRPNNGRYYRSMDVFERAKAKADESAPPPADEPIAAAAVAFGFGLLVIGIYFALLWLGLSQGMAWLGAAVAYATIAYADCALAWRRYRQALRDALADLKTETDATRLH